MISSGIEQRLQKILGILKFCQKIRSRLSHTIGQGCTTGAASFFFSEVFLIFLFKEKVFEEDVLTLEDKHTGIIFGYGFCIRPDRVMLKKK